ncbi:hypothetical protein Tco_0124429, partial [Tanacetum coccineum]
VQSTESHKQSTQSHKYEDEREADRQQIQRFRQTADRQQIQIADNSNNRLRQIRIQTADSNSRQTNARRRNYPNNI